MASSLFVVGESVVAATIRTAQTVGTTLLELPQLERENALLRAGNRRLNKENARLHELAAAYAAESAVRPVVDLYHGIEARVVGFPPENESRAVTLDQGTRAGIRRDDGVIDADGVVGRIASAGPFSSTVVLATDYTSRIPAIVQRGRWWGIARGNVGSVVMEYIPQDAPLRIGDVVVTGEGRSFHAGIRIGRVAKVFYPQGALYQTAVVTPSVPFGRLNRVLILRRDAPH